jgi:hypothetical protein
MSRNSGGPRALNVGVNVLTAARSIGLTRDDRGEVSGTIDESVVLAVISELAAADPANADLFADAAARVRVARSAGVVQPAESSVFSQSRHGASGQLRYRSEMAEVLTDLAIDVGLRDVERLADTPA